MGSPHHVNTPCMHYRSSAYGWTDTEVDRPGRRWRWWTGRLGDWGAIHAAKIFWRPRALGGGLDTPSSGLVGYGRPCRYAVSCHAWRIGSGRGGFSWYMAGVDLWVLCLAVNQSCMHAAVPMEHGKRAWAPRRMFRLDFSSWITTDC